MITNESLSILLSEDRNEKERLDSLHKLRNYLDQEDIITSLANLAKKEQSLAIRKALLKIVVKAEITNIDNRENFLKILFHFSSVEKEKKLRLKAVKCLSSLAFKDKRIELLLAENLLYDTSEAIQKACLSGLQKTGCKDKTTINTLSLYAQKVTDTTIKPFVTLLAKLPTNQSEPVFIALLHPLNNANIKTLIIKELAKHTALKTTTIQRILEILVEDNDNEDLEKSILLLLDSRAIQDLSIVDTIIENLRINPKSKTKLTPLLKRLIMTSPAIVDKVKTLYKSTNSISLKATILTLLNKTEALDIALEALVDPNLYIRYQGLHYCTQNIKKDTQGIVQAMVRTIQQESDIHLRSSLISEISKVNYLDEVSEKMLLEYYNTENNPWVLEELTKVLFLIPLRNNNKEVVLKAYIKTLNEIFFTDQLKNYVVDQLSNFQLSNFSNTYTPKLAQCLITLMLQDFDIGRIKKLYHQYSQLEHKDDDEHIKLVLLLFERFAHFYPIELLNIWGKELKHKAATNELVGEKADFLAEITGENAFFLLNKSAVNTTSSLIKNIITSIRKGQNGVANKLLQDAYRNRKIKKEEIVQLFKILLTSFDNTGLIYEVFGILREQHLITTEIVEIALDFINSYPDSSLSGSLQSMLSSTGKNLPEYAPYLENKLTPKNYTTYTLRTYQIRASYDLQWNNNWKDVYRNWASGELWSELYPEVSFLKFFSNKTDLDLPDNQNLDYYILRKFSDLRIEKEVIVGSQTISGEEVLLAIGNKIEQLEPNNLPGSFYDRTLYVFITKWKEFVALKEQPSIALTQCATKIYYAIFKRWKEYQWRVSHELLDMPLWLDFNLLSTLLKKDTYSFTEFFNPYYELIKTEAKHKVQNNIFPNREQPPQYRVAPTFNFLSLNNYISNVVDFILTAKWSDENENKILKEALLLIRKVWKGASGDIVMKRLQLLTENKRNEVLKQL